MDLSPFKLDIDELINEFVEGEFTTLADMKRVWLSRKFTYIFEASSPTKLAFIMQSLYAHTIGELKKLKTLVINAKEHGIKGVPALVKRMLEKNMFLFGFVDLHEGSVSETGNQLTELQDARVQVAYKKLFDDIRIEQFLHMDMVNKLVD
ncbi:uncharacterized protein LOC18097717 isoform X2 [Populus trichocarpa]|nr:uncharacterized protein LOC18097717 isoform X2 [Populus trichocarpa]|eukprot:XP_024465859.1 uncharacterized protein LOC18097717 isoform X1 [Populus trichocarpa]